LLYGACADGESQWFGGGQHAHPRHIAVNGTRRSTAIDGRTMRHPGYEISLQCRKRIEDVFGWVKASAGLTKFKLKGLDKTKAAFSFFAAAYNLVRLPKLLNQ
jgi:hypothetical protein